MALSLIIDRTGATVSGTDAQGRAWDVRYEGHADALSLWSAVNADGFYLAPGADFRLTGCTPVVRA